MIKNIIELIKSKFKKSQKILEIKKLKILGGSAAFASSIAFEPDRWVDTFLIDIVCLWRGDSNDIFKYTSCPNSFRAMSWRKGSEECPNFLDF